MLAQNVYSYYQFSHFVLMLILRIWLFKVVTVELLKRNSQLWDRADLDTSWVHPNLKSKYIWNFASISALFSFSFNRLLKNLFLSVLSFIL